MDICFLDKESLMVLVICRSPLNGEKLEELAQDIPLLKEKGAMGFIFDLTKTPYVASGAINFLSLLGAEAVAGNDKLRVICPNSKIKLNFELAGLTRYLKLMGSAKEAAQDLKQALFIEDELLEHPSIYKSSEAVASSSGQKVRTIPPPPKASTAKPDEGLPMKFKFEDLTQDDLSNPYLLPPAEVGEAAILTAIKHLSFKMKDKYARLQEVGEVALTSSHDELIAKRGYPIREWARSFAVLQGEAPKVRHLLLTIGAYVHKKAKSLSYSKAQALDAYEYDCYFALSILEPCTLFGEPQFVREAHSWKYQQYSNREDKIQNFVHDMLPSLKQYLQGKPEDKKEGTPALEGEKAPVKEPPKEPPKNAKEGTKAPNK